MAPGTTARSDKRRNEAVNCLDRLRDDPRHLQERWDNRLVLEDGTPWERNLNGRAEVPFYGDRGVGPNNANWAVRVPSHGAVLERIRANPGVYVFGTYNGDRRYEFVVLILVAKAGGGPKVEIGIPARLYVFEDKILRQGRGRLALPRSNYEENSRSFHFSENGKCAFRGFPVAVSAALIRVVHGLPKVVDTISNDRAKMVRD